MKQRWAAKGNVLVCDDRLNILGEIPDPFANDDTSKFDEKGHLVFDDEKIEAVWKKIREKFPKASSLSLMVGGLI